MSPSDTDWTPEIESEFDEQHVIELSKHWLTSRKDKSFSGGACIKPFLS